LVVLYLGRLDPEKRVPALVDTFLSLGLPDDHVLCVAGDGIQRDQLRSRAAGHPNVRILGLVSEARKLDLLRGCDVFVLPSTAEGLALSLLEGMAAGCAVVATDAGEDGSALEGAGLVIPANPLRPALDDALARLIADPDLRTRLGAAARARAVDRFAGAGNADRVIGVYAEAIRAAAAARGTPTGAALP
jgi:glycosyltransferase involved in cell wall biosynthesis